MLVHVVTNLSKVVPVISKLVTNWKSFTSTFEAKVVCPFSIKKSNAKIPLIPINRIANSFYDPVEKAVRTMKY